MKIVLLILIAVAFAGLFFFDTSCVNDPCRGITTEGQYQVLNLFAPDSIALNDTLKVVLAVVSCPFFSKVTRIDSIYGNLQLVIAVYGTFVKMTGNCGPQPEIPCGPDSLKLNFPFVTRERGTLKIVVFEPYGPNLIDSVRVY